MVAPLAKTHGLSIVLCLGRLVTNAFHRAEESHARPAPSMRCLPETSSYLMVARDTWRF
jgi:hypothetical protein